MSEAYGRPAKAACWARRIFDAATICMALVIFAVFLTELIRRLMSRVLGMQLSCQVIKLSGYQVVPQTSVASPAKPVCKMRITQVRLRFQATKRSLIT